MIHWKRTIALAGCTAGLLATFALAPTLILRVHGQTVGHYFTRYATYTVANLKRPTGIYINPAQPSQLFISDTSNNRILRFTIGGGLSPVAGNETAGYVNGPPSSAEFNGPSGLSGPGYVVRADPTHPGQETIFVELDVVDGVNNVVRHICIPGVIDPRVPPPCATASVSTTAGSGTRGYSNGSSGSAEFNQPALSLLNSAATSIYVADSLNHVIRTISTSSGTVSTYAGNGTSGYVNGPLSTAEFFGPTKITADSASNLYVSDVGNFVVRKISASGTVSTFAGSHVQGYADGPATSARFSMPTSLAYNSADGYVYVADRLNNCIRRIDSSGNVSTYAGTNTAGNVNGSLAASRFSAPTDLAIVGTSMYVSDMNNNAIRLINMSSGTVSTLID